MLACKKQEQNNREKLRVKKKGPYRWPKWDNSFR